LPTSRLAAPVARRLHGSDDLLVATALENESLVLPSDIEVVDARLNDRNGGPGIKVKREVQDQYASGNTSVYALRELYDSRADPLPKSFRMKDLEITYRYVPAPDAPKLEPSPPKPPGVTVLAQIGSASKWADLKGCMWNVALAMEAEGHGFSVFFAFQEEIARGDIDRIEGEARDAFGSGAVRTIRVENKGADIGPYLRQLQILGGQSPRALEILNAPEADGRRRLRPQALKSPEFFDTFLKIHSKSDDLKRRSWLHDLCGDVKRVRNVYRQFKKSRSLGMVGASEQVVLYPHRTKEFLVWGKDDIHAMKKTWRMMQPCVPFDIPLRVARIIAGSFYWARPDAVVYQMILHSADKLVMSMPERYKTNTTAQTSHALERLMPTMAVAVRGFDVAAVDELEPFDSL